MRVARSASGERPGPPAGQDLREAVEWRDGAGWFGFSWCHSRPPLSPNTRMCRPCSAPAAELVTHIEPRAPPAKRSSRCGVVVHLPARHRAAELGGELDELEPGDEAREMVGMGADVAEHQRRRRPVPARSASSRPDPVGLGLAARWPWMYSTWSWRMRAERAAPDHRPGVAHHRIAGVVVGRAEHEAAASHSLDQVERVGERRGERLVADHVEAPCDGVRAPAG